MGRIRILLVDDHDLVRRNIRRLLADHADFDLVGEATTGIEAIGKTREHQPDVILLDISMPELSGVAALPMILKASPQVKVLMVSSHGDSHFARACVSAGARGFLTKSDLTAELALAIRQVYADEPYVSKSLKIQDADEPMAPSMGKA